MQISRTPPIPQDEAETLAIRALGFLAAEPERLERFLALTGVAPDQLRRCAGDRGFLASLLEYLLSDEALLLTFSANEGIAPERIAPAQAVLAGMSGDGS